MAPLFSTSGPRPLRTNVFPRGFPWLRNHDAEQVQLANFFVDRSIALASTQVSTGGFFLFEHPEQLGAVKTGHIPGSIWDFPSMRELIESSQSATWGIRQCFFGSETPKPTRLGSNLPGAWRFGQCWHVLDESGKYLGPLGTCPHDHDSALIGRCQDGWRTAAAAAYPPMFCEYLARLILSATTSVRSVAEHLDAPHAHPAEALSQVLLQTGQAPLPDDILAVFELLPHTRAHASTGDQGQGKAFFQLGACRSYSSCKHLFIPLLLCTHLQVHPESRRDTLFRCLCNPEGCAQLVPPRSPQFRFS